MTASIINTDGRAIVLDLSAGATLCGELIAGLGVEHLSRLIDRSMAEAGTAFAFGRWAEPRDLYTTASFDAGNDERRTIHMGIDIFCAADTPVYAPLDGVVQYAANNDRDLDYGPMLILRHTGEDDDFFTLYGHLSMATLQRTAAGSSVSAGAEIATIGAPPVNGNWPPHLHFQVIKDLQGLGVDFPGVAERSRQDYWLELSPSPARFFPECDPERLEYK